MLVQIASLEFHGDYGPWNGRCPLGDITNTAQCLPVSCRQHGMLKGRSSVPAPSSQPRCRRSHPYSASELPEPTGCAPSSTHDVRAQPHVRAVWSGTFPPSALGHVENNHQPSENSEFGAGYVPDVDLILQPEKLQSVQRPSYMDSQPDLNPNMRALLVHWLAGVHDNFKLRSETLFSAVSLLDRFLMQKTTTRRNLQLVGVVALLIAAKFDESNPPTIQDFAELTDKSYSEEEIARMEVSMLTALEFRIYKPTSLHFLVRYHRRICCVEEDRNLAQRILQLTLVDYNMLQYEPSHLAAAVFLVSNKLKQRKPAWTLSAMKHTAKTELMLKDCAKDICGIIENIDRDQWHRKVHFARKESCPKNSSPFRPDTKASVN